MMNNARQAVFNILEEMKPGQKFSGTGLKAQVYIKTGSFHYEDTCLRYMRLYRLQPGKLIVNINKKKSIYEVCKND